jgi:hypothetical protein
MHETEVFMSMRMRILILWVVTPCTLVGGLPASRRNAVTTCKTTHHTSTLRRCDEATCSERQFLHWRWSCDIWRHLVCIYIRSSRWVKTTKSDSRAGEAISLHAGCTDCLSSSPPPPISLLFGVECHVTGGQFCQMWKILLVVSRWSFECVPTVEY